MILFKDLQKVLNKNSRIVLLYNNDGFSYNAFSDKLPEYILNSEVLNIGTVYSEIAGEELLIIHTK